jgi:hypothetical protein
MLKLTWARPMISWYGFDTDISKVTTVGIYIIWYNGHPGRVVRLGQGKIADRIVRHRKDLEIIPYRGKRLLITWAAVPAFQMNGVEKHLSEKYPPLVGDAFPDVFPIEVNSPW